MLKNHAKKLAVAGALVLGLAFAGTSSAQAGGYGYFGGGHHCVSYRPVVSYVCKEIPYEVCVVRYDHCGHPYHAYETQYRTVHVPVTRYVKVYH